MADIDIDEERCTTSPLVNGKVDDELTIEVKAARLKQGVKTVGSMQREGKRILQEKLKETVENCKTKITGKNTESIKCLMTFRGILNSL